MRTRLNKLAEWMYALPPHEMEQLEELVQMPAPFSQLRLLASEIDELLRTMEHWEEYMGTGAFNALEEIIER